MSEPISLVMPMAGRGSRFAKDGELRPKPLIELAGAPFYWWACESVRAAVPVGEMVFVVLREHCEAHGIDTDILSRYPGAKIVAIDEVTTGAAETAKLGVEALTTDAVVGINDCDHAFRAPGSADAVAEMQSGAADGALLTFTSDKPAYSYVRLDGAGRITGTVEKQVVSPHAIAGCYWFADPARMLDNFESYRAACAYDELFMSGLYNTMIEGGAEIARIDADRHVSFGTPEELRRVDPETFARDYAPEVS